ncbi:MAG: glycosyltransferase family 2 protein [Rhodobacteraceae bacterium]|nr:glycosyltransferase family 2 protein [Paracoccaceae bacterium]
MSEISVSVIVVSRGRSELLQLCLTALEQLYYPNYEIVVVTDPAGVAMVQAMGWNKRVKLVPFEEANISAARNAGIAHASGDVVAFIDDDAVAEPSWLTHLIEPFSDERVSAAGGFVRGRNGISYQWMANLLDHKGKNIPLDILDISSFVPKPPPGGAVKTEGTNCAFRRDVLVSLGGFDPVFRFFNDESDLNMRLARAGAATALVPLAQVHHGFAASDKRAADRAPISLFEIGASTMVFLQKYVKPEEIDGALERFTGEQRARLIRHMVSGGLEPCKVGQLMDELQEGIEEGKIRDFGPLAPLATSNGPFLSFNRANATGKAICLAGRWGAGKVLAQKAGQKVRAGNVVTVFLFSPTVLYHSVKFRKEGYWVQSGGIFGLSERRGPVWQFNRFRARAARERARVAPVRQNA